MMLINGAHTAHRPGAGHREPCIGTHCAGEAGWLVVNGRPQP